MARILIIDDEKFVRSSYRIALEGAGYTVVEAESGRKGLQLGLAEKFDLVITDVLMPEVDGLEIVREIKKKKPNSPIVAISGGAGVGSMVYLQLAEKLGANFVLAKPISVCDLISTVSRLAHS